MKVRSFVCIIGLMACWASRAVWAAPEGAETPIFTLQPDDQPVLSRPWLTVPLVSRAPVLDGIITPDTYAPAALITNFISEYLGEPSQARVEAYVARDANRLYLAFRAFDRAIEDATFKKPEPDKPDTYGGDLIELFFFPGETDRVQICASPLGARYDENSRQGQAWNGAWQSRGAVSDAFWTVEFSIPFSDLGLDALPPGYRLPANFVRYGRIVSSWAGCAGAYSDRSKSGYLFFDSTADPLPPTMTLAMDRWLAYETLDARALGTVSVKNLPADALLECALFWPGTQPAPLCRQSLPLRTPRATVAVDLSRLPVGAGRLGSVLRGSGGVELVQSQTAFRKEAGLVIAPERRGRLPLAISPSAKNSRAAGYINTGVPFPLGKLTDACGIRLLTASGREIALQTEVRARWRADGPIKWLGLIFEAPAEADRVELEYGTEVKPAAVAGAIRIVESEEGFVVDTGAAGFEILKRGFDGIHRIRTGDRLVSDQQPGDGPYLVNHRDERFVASADPEVRVRVERAGPLAVTLLAEGWFVKPGIRGLPEPADRLCRHSTRLTFYAGRRDVEIQQAVIITYDPRNTRLRDIGWSQQLDGLGGDFQTRFGIDEESAWTQSWNGRESLRLVQSRADKFTIETDKETLARGRRSAGWGAVIGQRAGIQAAVRDLCELFPKELEMAGHRLIVHAWPAHGKQETPFHARTPAETNAVRVMPAEEIARQGLVDDLTQKEIGHIWFCHTGRELDFRIPPVYRRALDEYMPDRVSGHKLYKDFAMTGNAQGLAIYTEFLLHVTGPGPSDAALETRAAAFQDELSAGAPAAWMCAADATDWLAPVDMSGPYGRMEWENIYNFALLAAAQDAAGDYGMFNYRDFHGDNAYWLGLDKGWNLNRLWNAGHHGVPRIPWLYYLRTGDARWLTIGKRNVRHLANVDVIHYAVPGEHLGGRGVNDESPYGHTAGAMYHCYGAVIHWGGDARVFGHPISFDPMLYSYYLTGDLRSLEVFREWTAAVRKVVQSGANIWRGTREGLQPLEQLVAAYEQEWDPVLLQAIQGFGNAILSTPGAQQDRKGFMRYTPYYLTRYYRLTHDPRCKPWLMEWIQYFDNPEYTQQMPWTVAGSLWGDRQFLKLAAETIYHDQLSALNPDSYPALDPWSRAAAEVASGQAPAPYSAPRYIHIAYNMHERALLFRAMDDAGVAFLPDTNRTMQVVPLGAEIVIARTNTAPLTLALEGHSRSAKGTFVKVLAPDGQAVAEKQMLRGYHAASSQTVAFAAAAIRRNPKAGMEINPPLSCALPQGPVGAYRLFVDRAPENRGFLFFPCRGAGRQYVRFPPDSRVDISNCGRDGWYFRTASGQTELNWTIKLPSSSTAAGIGIYDPEARRLIHVLGSGKQSLPVKAGSLYMLLVKGANSVDITSEGRELILGLSPQDVPPPAAPAQAVANRP